MSDQQPMAKTKGVADLVLLIDATGSMEECINQVKTTIASFIDSMSNDAQTPVRDWRARVIGYRDALVDGSHWLVSNPFVAGNRDELFAQLASLEAIGGGDEPESLLDALKIVTSWGQTGKGEPADPEKWRYRSDAVRVVLLFTDATYHPTTSDASGGAGGTADDIVNALNSEKIQLLMIAPDTEQYEHLGSANRALPIHRLAPNYVESLKALAADSPAFLEVMKALAKTVSKSSAVETL